VSKECTTAHARMGGPVPRAQVGDAIVVREGPHRILSQELIAAEAIGNVDLVARDGRRDSEALARK